MEYVTKIFTAAKAKWDSWDASTKLLVVATVACSFGASLWLS